MVHKNNYLTVKMLPDSVCLTDLLQDLLELLSHLKIMRIKTNFSLIFLFDKNKVFVENKKLHVICITLSIIISHMTREGTAIAWGEQKNSK